MNACCSKFRICVYRIVVADSLNKVANHGGVDFVGSEDGFSNFESHKRL